MNESLKYLIICAMLYTIAWIVVWRVVEWRMKTLFRHNHQKLQTSLIERLRPIERRIFFIVHLCFLLLLIGSIGIIYLLIY